MAVQEVNGRDLFYTRPNRSPGSPTLLLLHGAGGSHLDWPREIQRLPGANVYNLDLPGHGRSQGGGYDEIAAYAAAVDGFAAALDLTDVCVAGHSMGGAIALLLALERAPWLSSIVIMGSGASLPVSPQLLDLLQKEGTDGVELIIRYAWRQTSSAELVALADDALRAADRPQLYRSFLACDAFDVRERLGEVAVPTLIISGSEDRMTPPAYGRELAAGIRGARLVIIEKAGHYIAQEQPGAVAQAITAFVAEISGRAQDGA